MAEQYKVINTFQEKEHDGIVYKKNELYPKEGHKATKKRVAFLQKSENKYKKPFLGEKAEGNPEKVDLND